MDTKELVSIEDMTNWLQAQRTNSMNEGNLYEEIIVEIIKGLKEYEELKKGIVKIKRELCWM